MLSILFNLPSQPVSLTCGYTDFRSAVAYHCGYGVDGSLWTTAQIADLDRDVQEAYRWVLYPDSIPGERVPHVWSFLEQTTTLTTVADDYDYTLPADFGSIVGHYVMWGSGEGYAPLYRVSDTDLLFRRSNRTTTGRPECFALRWQAQTAGVNQRQEMLMHPTPDAAYVLTYRYAVLTGRLSLTNPYPLGGSRMSQLMLEASKAIGETKKNGQRGDQWALFMSRLMSAIQLDKGTNTPTTVGVMRPTDRSSTGWLQRKRTPTSYYYGPYTPAYGSETGSPYYTLEV